MISLSDRLFKTIILFCSVLVLQAANADELPVTAPGQLAVQLPDVDREALCEQLRTLRSQLILRKQELLQIVESQELDGGDAILTAILPGGLLYAGYKQVRHAQANRELDSVSADIEALTGDLLAIESTAARVLVAQLP